VSLERKGSSVSATNALREGFKEPNWWRPFASVGREMCPPCPEPQVSQNRRVSGGPGRTPEDGARREGEHYMSLGSL